MEIRNSEPRTATNKKSQATVTDPIPQRAQGKIKGLEPISHLGLRSDADLVHLYRLSAYTQYSSQSDARQTRRCAMLCANRALPSTQIKGFSPDAQTGQHKPGSSAAPSQPTSINEDDAFDCAMRNRN
jgi:hypothetical protein